MSDGDPEGQQVPMPIQRPDSPTLMQAVVVVAVNIMATYATVAEHVVSSQALVGLYSTTLLLTFGNAALSRVNGKREA